MVTIEEFYNHFYNDAIPISTDPIYSSMEWWTDFVGPYRQKIKEQLMLWHGPRELMEIYTDRQYVTGLGPVYPAGSWSAILIWVDTYINALLCRNAYKYKRLYDLYMEDFNPLWNVDGTVKTTFDWNMNRSGEDKNVASGTDTTSSSTTTYDSTADHATDKSGTNYGRTDTRTYTNLKDAKSGTETVARTGNIGVTKSTELAMDALKWSGMFKFLEILTSDMANELSYYF